MSSVLVGCFCFGFQISNNSGASAGTQVLGPCQICSSAKFLSVLIGLHWHALTSSFLLQSWLQFYPAAQHIAETNNHIEKQIEFGFEHYAIKHLAKQQLRF